MLRNHIGFALFMLLLLIAPKIPIKIPGGIERSSVSLGLAGLIIWFLTYPGKIFHLPQIAPSHPLFWIILFAIYAFVVSLFSLSIVSIAYSVQFLAYAVLGTILMRRSAQDLLKTNWQSTDIILSGIALIYSVGILISLFTGPIYPHQTFWTIRHWGGLNIQQGVGFSESQNAAGAVAIFFIAAGAYMPRNETNQKQILVCLPLLALLATLSRSAIISFLLAFTLLFCLDKLSVITQRDRNKAPAVKDTGLVLLVLGFAVVAALLGIYLVNKSLLQAVLSGFGLSGGPSVIWSDFCARLDLWRRGLNTWASKGLPAMVFGSGFRKSMAISSYGTWYTPHNVYIAILGDFGIVGLVLFLTAIFKAMVHYARPLLTGKARRSEKFGLMVVSAMSIHNLTGEFFYSPICLSLLIFTLAATL